MLESDEVNKHGLPPRDRNADMPEHVSSPILWMGGVIIVFAVLGLVLFGTTRMNDTTASNANQNAEQGTTTGSAPAAPPKNPQ